MAELKGTVSAVKALSGSVTVKNLAGQVTAEKVVQGVIHDGEVEGALWAYLDHTTVYLNRADDFVQNGTELEVLYDG